MTTDTDKARLVLDEPIEAYLAAPGWSHSMLEVARCSLERVNALHVAKSIIPSVDGRTQDLFDFGNATHCATLEPQHFDARWKRGPTNDRRTNKWSEAAAAVPPGAKLLQPSVYDMAELMAARVRCHPIVGPALERAGYAEASIYWTDEETGLPRKARPDYMIPPGLKEPGAIIELKTFGGRNPDPNPEAVARRFVDGGYHRKQANDAEAFRALFGRAPDAFVFAMVSKEPPHEVAAYALDDGSAELGEEQRRRDVRRVAEAIERGSFSEPWNTDVATLVLPAYAHFAE